MNVANSDGESAIYDAVRDLDASALAQRVKSNAADAGIAISDEHIAVVQALVEHYREACQQRDCRSASPHMRFLSERFAAQGGSRYLYRLFDRSPQPGQRKERGVLTLIHELAELPDLTHNEDEGFGTVF